jgi:DNA-binding CsgD family transcriptional regulator/GAF domain-containing protein
MEGMFPYATVAHVVSSAGFVLTTWLAAYLTVHVSRSSPARLAILSLFALSGYFLHTVLCVFVPADQIGHIWRRYMGWLALLPLPLWLHLTASLLPPGQRAHWQLRLWLTYATAIVLSILWAWGPWQFSRRTLLPPELAWPVALFAAAVGASALINTSQLQRQAADRTLRTRYALLSAVVLLLTGWILYWPIIDALGVPWPPTPRLAVGDGIPLVAVLVLAYAVAFHNTFMAGRWVKRDFFFHAAAIGAIAALYLLTVIGARELALAFDLDVATLTFITVVGLTLLTHWLAEPLRRWSDNLFFKQLRAAPGEMTRLAQDIRASGGQLEEQMITLVNRLKELTGASVVCIALRHGEQLTVKASTEPERIGQTMPTALSADGPAPLLKADASEGGHRPNGNRWDCLVLSEPIRANEEIAGYLLLGERGVGEGYDREERVWVSTLAAYLGIALEQVRRREETARRLSELTAEAENLAKQELSLQREFEAALAGPPRHINQQELREALYAYNRPERLAAILTREGSTLATLVNGRTPPVSALQQRLTLAVDSIAPPGPLPSLDSLHDRSVRAKRRRHLPAPAADYYTLRLVMAGHTHDDIAEMLEVSPRQVRNYLERAVNSVKVFLEHDAGAWQAPA